MPHPGPQSDRPRSPEGSESWTACAAESPLDKHQRLQPHSLARAQALSLVTFFDALVKKELDGYAKISSYKAWWFFRGEGIHQVGRGPEKPA